MCDDARNYISILTIKLSQLSSIRISISMYVCVLCVCVCVRVCVCVHMCVCVHICMHVSVYIRIHVSMYVHVCVHMCAYVSMHTYIYISAIKIAHLQYWHNVIIHRKATYVHQKQTSSGLYYSVIFPCFLSIMICGGTTFVWEQKLSHHE